MSHNNIGILTLASADNYGAVLQSYSLCRYLNDQYSNTEIMNFVPDFIVGRYTVISIKGSSIGDWTRSLIFGIIQSPLAVVKKSRFNSFRRKVSKYSRKKYIRLIDTDDYDYYILGSDQVLNLELTHNDTEFFLPRIVEPNRKSTYAASIGMDHLNDSQMDLFKKYIGGFEYISLREKTGCRLITELLPDRKVYQLPDPVFLHDKSFWELLENKRMTISDYTLIYSFKNFDLAYKIAKEICSERKIVVITDSIRKKRKDVINARAVGPREFLYLIHNAKCVITDSFHGTAFSVVYNKPFYSIPYKGTESRIVDMLTDIGLDKRIVFDGCKIGDESIDYSAANMAMESMKEKARNYFDQIFGR